MIEFVKSVLTCARQALGTSPWNVMIGRGLIFGAGLALPAAVRADPVAAEEPDARSDKRCATLPAGLSEPECQLSYPSGGRHIVGGSGAGEIRFAGCVRERRSWKWICAASCSQPGQRYDWKVRAPSPGAVPGVQLGVLGPVVDDDGIHTMIEKSGAVYLQAGRRPIRVDWFNGVEKYGLEVDYQGPALPRQRIPDSVLFRIQTDATGATNFVNGLDYACYEADGEVLPDFTAADASQNRARYPILIWPSCRVS